MMKTDDEKGTGGVSASLLFLVIAIAGGIPLWIAESAPPPGGPEPYGPGYRNAVLGVLCIFFVSIPASVISLALGLLSMKVSKLSYLSIIPTASFLIYCWHMCLRLN